MVLGAIENKLSARAVIALVRIAFGAMSAAEAIERRARRRDPSMPSLVDRLIRHVTQRDARNNAEGGRA